MTKSKSTSMTEIPLYLIPQAITRLIRKRGGKIYRISICRTHHHHYNISVRTRSLPMELRPVREHTPVFSDAGEGVA